MLMNTILNNIFEITKRPDQRPLTLLAIKDALQRMHNVGELIRDLEYATLIPSNNSTELATVQEFRVPNDYRKTAELYKGDGTNGYLWGSGKMYYTTSDKVRSFLAQGKGCYTIVGKNLYGFHCIPFNSVVLKYYKRCILTDTAIQEDWIIDDYNEMFTKLAASIVFGNLRNPEASRLWLQDYQIALNGFLLNELEDGNATEQSTNDDGWVGNHG